LTSRLEALWGIVGELATAQSWVRRNSDVEVELASISVSDVADEVSVDKGGWTGGQVSVSRNGTIVSGSADGIQTKRNSIEIEASSTSGSPSNVSIADGSASRGCKLVVLQKSERLCIALRSVDRGRGLNAIAICVDSECAL
jgi:hypothetical protein